MRAKLHNEEAVIREKMRVLQKANDGKMANMQKKINTLQTENIKLKRDLASAKGGKVGNATNVRSVKNASLFPGASKKNMISLKRPSDNNKGQKYLRRTPRERKSKLPTWPNFFVRGTNFALGALRDRMSVFGQQVRELCANGQTERDGQGVQDGAYRQPGLRGGGG